jgi:hypothetical protein
MDRTDIFDTMQSDANYAEMIADSLPEPPAGMDTKNMRFAIACGFLSADNRLGHADHPTFKN